MIGFLRWNYSQISINEQLRKFKTPIIISLIAIYLCSDVRMLVFGIFDRDGYIIVLVSVFVHVDSMIYGESSFSEVGVEGWVL